MVSYAFSAVLTGMSGILTSGLDIVAETGSIGLVFLSLGYFRLGALIGYFPRHILVG